MKPFTRVYRKGDKVARMLKRIREMEPVPWCDLCDSLGFDPSYRGSVEFNVRDHLQELKRVGIVAYEAEFGSKYGEPIGPISLTENWRELSGALGLSLTQLARFDESRSMIVHPFHGPPVHLQERADVFVAMPFTESMRPVYDLLIKPACLQVQLTVERADDLFSTNVVIQEIWAKICAARLVVADCTTQNPNVFYEVGLAHAIGKPVLFLAQAGASIPFDVAHVRSFLYDLTALGSAQVTAGLSKSLQSAVQERDA